MASLNLGLGSSRKPVSRSGGGSSSGASGSRAGDGGGGGSGSKGGTSSSSSGSTLRRAVPSSLAGNLSLATPAECIVLDVGARLCRAGFSGEAAPRFCVPTPPSAAPLFAPDTLRTCRSAGQREVLLLRLEEQATRLLRMLILDRLIIDPKGRTVLLLVHALFSQVTTDVLVSVLLANLGARSVSLVPSAAACALASGRRDVLLLDLAPGETRCALVADLGTMHLPYRLMSTTRSRRSVLERLKVLLMRFGKHVAATPASASRKQRTGPITEAMLAQHTLDDILDRWLFVPPPAADAACLAAPREGELDEAFLAQQHAAFASSSTAQPLLYPLRAPPSLDPQAQRTTPATLGTALPPVSPNLGTLVLPGWVRERAAEVLFEPGDEDELSLVEAVLELLLHAPVDLRRTFASNILVVGGLAYLPNLPHRLRLELEAALAHVEAAASSSAASAGEAEAEKGTQLALSQVRVGKLATREERERRRALREVQAQTAAQASEAGEGGKAADVVATPQAAVSSNKSLAERYAPLASLLPHLQVLNDHSRPAPGGPIPLSPHLFPWVGGSLAGALLAVAGELGGTLSWTRESFLAARAREPRPPARPQGAGRGSFMGVVGGLHTGAWGALSAHLGGARSPPARS